MRPPMGAQSLEGAFEIRAAEEWACRPLIIDRIA